MSETAQRSIVLNGEPIETRASTLAELIIEAGFGEARVATALNGTFVAAGLRGTTQIGAGDRVEVLSARQGG